MKALRRLTVRAAYPQELAGLGEIVANLRWSWHADSIDLFESVDPDLEDVYFSAVAGHLKPQPALAA